MDKILVTGGSGFIGTSVIRHLINSSSSTVLNIDKLTYAGNLNSLRCVDGAKRYNFIQGDICDSTFVEKTLFEFKPNVIMHLAAESHVDRSIGGPQDFIQTNIVGTFKLLEATRNYWLSLKGDTSSAFRFHHVSTDEVYGELTDSKNFFSETSPYDPSSPYSASKASSDHLVRAWHRTFGLPVVITNCSNNYGPYQFPEKLIPRMILNAISGKRLPIYGDGSQIRDWLHVDDHARALIQVASDARSGETYNIGGHNEIKNIDVVRAICSVLEELVPIKPKGVKNFADLITFVEDRPGHDKRYAIDSSKILLDLGWAPRKTFDTGLPQTVEWYLKNRTWWQDLFDNGDF